MASHTIGIIVNGATGRIGSTQHLANALIPIIAEGGLALGDDRLVPRLLLTGRDAARLAAVARAHKVADWTTDLDAALADPAYAIFFDAAATQGRVAVLEKALAAGKHVYCEKPVAPAAAQGVALLREARRRGVKHGVVEDKIHLPGLQKLAALTRSGALGRVVGFKLEFGWWVFDGSEQPCQRPSWNYRAGGGGIILDMYPHWRYVIESIVGRIVRVASSAWIATPEGSAVAGLHRCHLQSTAHTPAIAHFSVMRDIGADYREAWTPAPPLASYRNPYRVGWEAFLRHVAADAPLACDFAAGIRDVAFADACHRSMRERSWVALPPSEDVR